MKEIGIEKLVELLNEYEAKLEEMPLARRKWREESGILYRRFMNVEDAERMVISKSFGFIKWLVENDKIERPEIRSQGYTKPTYGYTTEPYTTCKSIELANTILMILAIKDEPIRFLCEILK